jgi:hypothetical protein
VALATLGGTGASPAQVSFEQVEQALAALEASVASAPPPAAGAAGQVGAAAGAGAEAGAGLTLPPALTTPPPTSPPPHEVGGGAASAEHVGGIEFPPILEGQDCPTSLPDITEGAENLAAELRRTEAEMTGFERVFASLEEENAALVADRDDPECPADFVEDVEVLIGDLAAFDLMTGIQAAESFSACAQARVQALNDRMLALQSSTDPNAGADRLAVGQLLSRMAVVDGEVSRGVGTYVFFDQRRGRLETAARAILRRCQILSGY